MPYTLKHTAEELDRKLYLIDENKNRLPYPYEEAIPTGLEDVGDGSILTVDVTSSEKRALLNTCTLPAGKYIVSLDTTNIIDEITTAVANPGFSLEVVAADTTLVSTDNFVTLELADETAIAVYLNIPTAFDANILIKPQIEPGETKTAWVPYMGTIGSYVDERFNSTNAKIKAAVKALDGTKVNKVAGKDLSTNDYTNIEKIKLAGIEDGAEKNIQPDWNQNDETKADYIKNRTHYETVDYADIYNMQDISNIFKCPKKYGEATVYQLFLNDYPLDNSVPGTKVKVTANVQIGSTNITTNFECTVNDEYTAGNPALFFTDGEDNGESGGFYSDGKDHFLYILHNNEYEYLYETCNLDIQIQALTTVVVKIDEKYIPDSIAKKSDVSLVDSKLSNKVDKISGKSLSTNDYTNSDKEKLSSVQYGAEKNVQPDWQQPIETSPDYIKNKTHYDINVFDEERLSFGSHRSFSFTDRYYNDLGIYYIECNSSISILERYSVGTPFKIEVGTYYNPGMLVFEGIKGADVEMGNPSLCSIYSDTDTGENCCVYCDGKDWYIYIATNESLPDRELDIRISYSINELKQLDEKFIPNTIARTTDIQAEVDRAKAVEADLQGQIDIIIDNPETADTIDSIKEFTTYIEQHGEIAEGFRADIAGLQTEVGNKVDKVDGKGLSTNDFNNTYKKTLDTIKPGTGDNSIVINDGTASGAYSIAGGTTNKDFVDGVTGGIAGALTTLHPSEAIGELSIALGADNKAITAGSMALGYDNIAGGKGYYVTAINVATKTITLSTKQTSTSNPGTVSWSKGDRLFFVNDERYFLEIASISGNVVTLVDMPFTSLMSTNSLTGKPNDRAIINLDKPESGTIDIGWGAMSTGIQNEAVGSSSYAMGYKNIVAGDFGTAFGMENIVGYSAFATGNNNKASGKRSFASGDNNTASGALAHAEGGDNTASGDVAHVEGSNNKATGWASHAEGGYTTASASKAHAEGHETTASGINSHAEGKSTTASGENAHAEGQGNTASGIASHAEGYENKVSGNYAHVEGRKTEATKEHAHAEGYNTRAYGACAHTEGHNTEASGEDAHAEGKGTQANSYTSHAEGLNSIASGQTSHAEGISTESGGKASHTEGELTKVTKDYGHAEGYKTQTIGYAGHTEGGESTVNASYGHAEGYQTVVNGRSGHAEGSNASANGDDSHAEGYKTIASGGMSHAEGDSTNASGSKSHAEGQRSIASGENAHAEGKDTEAKSINTHAEGFKTIANGAEQHVQGRYNIEDTDKKYAHIVGNGTGDDNRSNAHTVDWNGNAWFAGNISVGEDGARVLTEKDRTHYDNKVIETIRASVGTYYSEEDYYHFSVNIDSISEYPIGTTFTVTLKGILDDYGPESYTFVFTKQVEGNYAHNYAYDRDDYSLYINDKEAELRCNISFNHFDVENITATLEYGTVVQLDEKFIPENVVRKADLPLILNKSINAVSQTGTNATGNNSVSFGENTSASGTNSFAEGYNTEAVGYGSHAEGGETEARTTYGHAEGFKSISNGRAAHAEGSETQANNANAHAEGYQAIASGEMSHAEGGNTVASATRSHAEGHRSQATGENAHAEGKDTKATKYNSHAEGLNTIAGGDNQHVQGKYNVELGNNYAHIVGGGSSDSDRKNIHTIDWDGNAYFAGSIKIGNTTITEAQLIKLLELISE